MPPVSATNRTAEGLERLAESHRDAVWRYLRVLGCDASTADDLTHEVFLVVLRRPAFDASDPRAAFAFLRATARNLLLAQRRSRRALREIEDGDRVWDARCGEADGSDRLDALQRCLSALPARSRQLLEAAYRDGETRETIARRFDLSSQGVKSALRRLRNALHRCICERLEVRP